MRAVVRLAVGLGLVACLGCAERRAEETGAEEGEGRDARPMQWLRQRITGIEPYALDEVPRSVEPGDEVTCDRDTLVTHDGETLSWDRSVRVHPAFVERLERFEKTAHDVAIGIYGRPPTKIEHAGAFACRTVRGRETRLSEHALGNAVDLVGFRFGPLPEDKKGPDRLPEQARKAFRVTIFEHWEAEDEDDAIHERFFGALTEKLAEERVFRGMIGPSQEGHERHLHLDAGPYVYQPL